MIYHEAPLSVSISRRLHVVNGNDAAESGSSSMRKKKKPDATTKDKSREKSKERSRSKSKNRNGVDDDELAGADSSGRGRNGSPRRRSYSAENDGPASPNLAKDISSGSKRHASADASKSRTRSASKRAPSTSFAVPDPAKTPTPPQKAAKKKKTTTTTTMFIKTTTTKKKITTTQVVSEDAGIDDAEGPRRSRRNRTETAGHCTAVYKWENGFKVKVGEQDMADDPKFAHLFVKGALVHKNKGGKKGRKPSGSDGEEERRGKKRKTSKSKKGTKVPVAESDEEEEEEPAEDDVVDPGDEWIDVLADDQPDSQAVSKRLFRPISSHEYMSVDRGAFNLSFMKTFDQGNYSSGALILGPSGVKESQIVKNADMIFFCQKGVVRVTLHETEIIVKKGDTFCAPRFNKYSIANDSDTEDAKLVFFQAKFRD